MDKVSLPLPAVRCLSKEEAAQYLGIGVTLLMELEIPSIESPRYFRRLFVLSQTASADSLSWR
ncbi:hypothetical protein [Nitrosomonas sp.]|uniref:hypothetical protein n=1 Tax=Nitrosomonas sp. TaxID=42353 RepID=UPI00260037B0|nr:hypothetical protein [Nitrosomonas sp.]